MIWMTGGELPARRARALKWGKEGARDRASDAASGAFLFPSKWACSARRAAVAPRPAS